MDPLTRIVSYIPVTSGFIYRYNIFACISGNTTKPELVIYNIACNNGNSVSYMNFLSEMVWSGHLRHNKILVIDNSLVCSEKESRMLVNILWNTIINSKPLNIYVLVLAAQSPE